jgi:hypothetical protein
MEKVSDSPIDVFDNEKHIEKAKNDLNEQITKTKKLAYDILPLSLLLIIPSAVFTFMLIIVITGNPLNTFTFPIILSLLAGLFVLLIGIVLLIITAYLLSNVPKKTLKFPFRVENENNAIKYRELDYEKVYDAVERLIDAEQKNLNKQDLETFNHFRNYLFNYDQDPEVRKNLTHAGFSKFIALTQFIKKNKNSLQVTPIIKILECLENIVLPKLDSEIGQTPQEINICYQKAFNLLPKFFEINDFNFLAMRILITHSQTDSLMTHSLKDLFLLKFCFRQIVNSINSISHLEKLFQEITEYSGIGKTKCLVIEEKLKTRIKFEMAKIYFQKILKTLGLGFRNTSLATETLFKEIAIPIWKIYLEKFPIDGSRKVMDYLNIRREVRNLLKELIIKPLKKYAQANFSILDVHLNNNLKMQYLEPLTNKWESTINDEDFESIKKILIEILENADEKQT